MARTKHTDKAPAKGLPPAVKEFRCSICSATLKRKPSWVRHMLVRHKKNPDGTEADPLRIQQYTRFGQNTAADKHRRAEQRAQAVPDQPPVSIVTITKDHPSKRKGRKHEQPAAYPAPDSPDSELVYPDTTSLVPPAKPGKDKPVPGPSRQTDPAEEACIRKPCRPMKPVCRRVKRLVAPPIIALPKRPVTQSPAKRRVRILTPGKLAKIVSRRVHVKPSLIAEEIAERYAMTPEQRRATTNQIIAMRALQRRVSTDIRKKLPVRRTKRSVAEFLDGLSATLDEVSTSDSTEEFV